MPGPQDPLVWMALDSQDPPVMTELPDPLDAMVWMALDSQDPLDAMVWMVLPDPLVV